MFGRIRAYWRRRSLEKETLRRRQYAAAQVGRLVGSWMPAYRDVNELIAFASPIIRNRTRQLVRDFPPFCRAVNNIVNFTVGSGVRFQSRMLTPEGEADKPRRQMIEDRFNAWMDQADVRGKLHFHELQQLAARQDGECGEYLAAVTTPRRPGRHPFSLQFYEPERLTEAGAPFYGQDTIISQGIEFLVETGEPVAYYVADEGYGRNALRIDADNILHDFQTLRPGQIRGISPFAPAIMIARDLSDYLQAEIDAAKLASKWLAFVTVQDAEEFQNLRVDVNGSKVPVEKLENAIIEYLQPGEEVKFASHQRPGQNFDPFSRFTLRMVSITVDQPYELLSGDYTGINYTTLRGIRNDFRQMLSPRQYRHELHFSRRILRLWMAREALMHPYDFPGFWLDPSRYLRGQWIPVGMPEIDPLRETKSAVEAINAGLKSPQEVILARGGDPDEVLDQNQDWKAMCEERGLTFNVAGVSTSLANNPAAVDPDTAESRALRRVK